MFDLGLKLAIATVSHTSRFICFSASSSSVKFIMSCVNLRNWFISSGRRSSSLSMREATRRRTMLRLSSRASIVRSSVASFLKADDWDHRAQVGVVSALVSSWYVDILCCLGHLYSKTGLVPSSSSFSAPMFPRIGLLHLQLYSCCFPEVRRRPKRGEMRFVWLTSGVPLSRVLR